MAGAGLGPPPPPPAYGAGYAPPAAEGGRLPTVFVVGSVAGAMMVFAGLAIAVAILGPPSAPPGDPGTGPGPTADPGGQPGVPRVIDVANISIEVPAAWRTVRADPDTVGVADQASNVLWLRSTVVGEAFTLDSLQQRLFERFTEQSPDASICAGPESAPLPGGPTSGRYFMICYTHIPLGGGVAARLSDAYYVAIDGAGTTVAVMQLTAPRARIDEFAISVRALPPPHWKLLAQ